MDLILVELIFRIKMIPSMKPTLERWESLSKLEVSTSASSRRARRSDAIMFEQNKQIFFKYFAKDWIQYWRLWLL